MARSPMVRRTMKVASVVGAAAALAAASGATAPRPQAAADSPRRVLRVCADPNNLPFSNSRGEGFENRIAQLIATDLHATIQYTWWAQRRGFVRETLSAGSCDVIPGVPSAFERTLVTRPYYRSAYVFVSRRDRGLRVTG